MTTKTKFTVGEYKTRDGHNAKVFMVCEDGRLIGATQYDDGSWTHRGWWASGMIGLSVAGPYDLMPPLRECWLIDGSAICHNTREEAEERVKYLLAGGVPGPFPITKYREVPDDQA